ncbi:putative benzoate 4-monooxygenase cytochrome p450 [Diaporthe ampelina]|uniref:Putative benzoate 4-monooxygenase cytochrome p450 n=1 Tax=Diaporthe ampelina TaxID=1214573 RepID=A0A0G2IF26_9PEZI|nr:putative benzoate 4-monooxygenase cytochrome p450 [Diaporthe ampelina]
MRYILRGDQQMVLAKAHEKYGPFVRIAHDEVSVCHEDVVKSLFITPLHKSKWYKIFALPDYRTPAPIGLRDPKDKLKLNTNFRKGYEAKNVIRSEPYMDEVLVKLFSWLDKSSEEKTPLKLGDFFSYAAYDITGEVTFSKSFGFTEKGEDIGGAIAVNEAMELFFVLFGYVRHVSYIFCNPLTTWLGILPLGYMGEKARSALADRKKNPDARFDIAAHWFRSLEKNGPSKAWNDDMSFVYHLIRHPDAWRRIRDEIDTAQKEGRCQDEIVTYNDAAKLPFLQANIKEALRIFAPVPSILQATLVRDYDFQQVNPKEEWEYKAYFTVVPHGWPVYVTKRSMQCWLPENKGFSSLVLLDVPFESPKVGQVLVRIKAVSLNWRDCILAIGTYAFPGPDAVVPGSGGAGA